jgi:hypothetical protein
MHVDIVRLPLKNQSARGMRQQGEARMVHGTQDARGLPLPGPREVAMHGADYAAALGSGLCSCRLMTSAGTGLPSKYPCTSSQPCSRRKAS